MMCGAYSLNVILRTQYHRSAHNELVIVRDYRSQYNWISVSYLVLKVVIAHVICWWIKFSTDFRGARLHYITRIDKHVCFLVIVMTSGIACCLQLLSLLIVELLLHNSSFIRVCIWSHCCASEERRIDCASWWVILHLHCQMLFCVVHLHILIAPALFLWLPWVSSFDLVSTFLSMDFEFGRLQVIRQGVELERENSRHFLFCLYFLIIG